MISVSKIGEVAERAARNKITSARTFHAAYKKAPAQTLGHYAKTHKASLAIETGLTAASFVPNDRRSSHKGIDQK